MHKTGKPVKRYVTGNTGKPNWAGAIAVAEEQLRKNRIHAARLRAAIKAFREWAAAGKPWPGDEIIGQKSELLGRKQLLGKAILTCKK